MIRFEAALDSKHGIADDHGVPWQGKVPGDVKYYRNLLKKGIVLMGYGLYKELSRPYKNEHEVNYVATRNRDENLREGFVPVYEVRQFIKEQTEEVWITGGAILFESTVDLADELYLTQLEGDFHCTKFFPAYEKDFGLVSQSEPITENGIKYHFEVWKRKEPQS